VQQYQIAVIGIMHFPKGGDDAQPIQQIVTRVAHGAVARVTYEAGPRPPISC